MASNSIPTAPPNPPAEVAQRVASRVQGRRLLRQAEAAGVDRRTRRVLEAVIPTREEVSAVRQLVHAQARRRDKEERSEAHKSARPLCGARCRDGHPCRARVVEKPNGAMAKRCRMHGGRSSGCKTEAGREAIRESNRRRARARAEAASTCSQSRANKS